ncbi:MAG: hypothetical protein ABI540_09775 [Spartobacteria bacterium]
MASISGGEVSMNEQGDLFFECAHCRTPFVVNASAAGMTLNCQRCGKPTSVPASSPGLPHSKLPATSTAEQLAEFQRHLKENESQRTEVNGYINQLSIQLHRWQLRLQTLDERNRELRSKLESAGSSNQAARSG